MKRLLPFSCLSAVSLVAIAAETSFVNYSATASSAGFSLIWSYETTTADGITSATITGVKTSGGANPTEDLAIPYSVSASATGPAYVVKTIADGAFANQIGITSISIPVTIESIGSGVFSGCTVLSSISVDDGNPWFSSFGGALYDRDNTKLIACPARTEIIMLPATLTEICQEAFANCHRLLSLSIPASVTDIGSRAFMDCSRLASVEFKGNAPTADGTIAMGANPALTFYKDAGSTGWEASPWDVLNVQNAIAEQPSGVVSAMAGNVAWHYRVIDGEAEIYYNDSEAAISTSTSQTFHEELIEGVRRWVGDGRLVIPSSLGGYPVTRIGISAFKGCSALAEIEIPNTVRTIGDFAFARCTGINSLNVPSGVRKIGRHPFSGAAISSITLPDSLRELDGNPLAGCDTFLSVSISADNSYFTVANGILYDKDLETLIGCPARKETTSIAQTVKKVGPEAFDGCFRVREILLPDSLTSVSANAFCSAIRLTSITFPSRTTNLEGPGLFAGCASLSSVNFLCDAPSVDSRLFDGAPNDLVVYTAHGTTGWKDSTSEFPDSGKWPSDNEFGRAISNLYVVTENHLTVPVDVTVDGKQFTFNWRYEIDIETATAKLITVEPKPINEIEIPGVLVVSVGGTTYSFAVTEICDGAFRDAQALTKVKTSAQLLDIGDFAFSNCTALAELELSYGLRHIGKRPFVNTAIPELTLPDTLLDMEGNIAAGAIYDMQIKISDSSHFTFSDDGVLYNRDMTKLYACPTRAEGTVIIPSSVTNICQDAFFGCFRLTYLNIPENVDVIGSDAFNVYGIWPDLIWLNRPPQESAPKLQYVFYEGSNEIAHAENDIYDHAPSSLTNFVFSENWNTNGWKNRPVVYIPPEDSNIPVPVLSYKDDNGITWFYRIIKGTAEIYNEEHGKSCAAIKPSSISGVLYTRSENDDTITSYGLRVPYSINGFAVTSIGSNAFENCSALVCIGLPASVQKIGDYAFKGCTALRAIDEYYNAPFFVTEGNISLPVGITEIGYHAFEDLNMTSISIPYTLTSTKGNPFAGLKHLTTVEVDSRNSKFTALGNVLYDKRRTTVIGVPVNYDESSISFPPSITTMGYEAMYGCANMVSISLPDSLVTISTNAFSSCSNVVSLTIPENVTFVDSKAFCDCVSLTNVTYQGCAATNAVDDIYKGAQKVESTIFSDSPEIVAAWTNAATNLTATTTTNETSHEITTLYTGKWNYRPINITLSSTTIPVNKEQHITIGNVTWYYHEVDGMAEIWREGNKTAVESDDPIMSLSLPSTLGGYIVKGIGDGALSDLRGITSISVPNTYEWIGDYAFSNCTSLASVSLGNGIEKIGHWPFFGTKITSLTIPDSVSEIDGNPVAGCSLMQAVVAADSQPNFSVADGLLYDKRKETLYACPATKTAISLPESLKQINDDAFYGCNLNDDSYVIVDGVTWGFTSASDGGAKITSVQNADGTITIPASLAGRPVTEIEDGAFADCGEVKAFVSKSPAFKARNGVLYSADGKDLICVPNMMRLPYTVKTSTSTATIEEHSEAGVRGGLPYVDVTTTTNVSATTTTTEKFNGDISADTLLAGVTHIRDYAFSGVNVFTNTYDAVTNGPSIGSAIPGNGKVNSYVITTSFDIESVEYSTILTVNQATTTVAPNATTDSGVEIVFSNTPRGSTEPRLRVSNTSGLPPSDAVSVYDGFIMDASDDVAGTAQVKLAKSRNGKAIVTMTLLPANAKKITAKGILDTDSGVVSGLDISLGSIVMYGTYGGYSINGARNLSKSKNKDEAAKSAADLKFWLGAVNVAWEDGTLTVTIAAKGKAKISGTLANGTKVSVSSQAINFGDRLCVPIVVTKKASVSALLWLPLNTGEGVEVEGLGDTAAGKPGSIRPRAEFQLDRNAVAKLALDEASIPFGGITPKGTQWSINDGTGRVALKLRYTAKTGAIKGTFKASTEQNGRRKNTSVSVTGVVIGDSAYGFATVKKSGSAPFEIK